MPSSLASWMTELRRSSSVAGADNPMCSALREAKSRRSSSNWRLASSFDAICHPALMARARTMIPTMSAILFMRVNHGGPALKSGWSQDFIATTDLTELDVSESSIIRPTQKTQRDARDIMPIHLERSGGEECC